MALPRCFQGLERLWALDLARSKVEGRSGHQARYFGGFQRLAECSGPRSLVFAGGIVAPEAIGGRGVGRGGAGRGVFQYLSPATLALTTISNRL
ncbi:MAG: hypothetical protein HC942_30605 [Microcoleus sp. SU_5_6]|nr:hypothetical protein [Microcoleus sp. SU_5_6]